MTIRDVINRVLDRQNQKGMSTYGRTLDDCPDGDYDWNEMAVEELIDALQYLAKENNILRKKLANEIDQRIHIERLLNKLTRGEQIDRTRYEYKSNKPY
ncbi:MAG: hypothetical protein ACI35R_02290 [Bacillus sp. (in: firmicutes)]